MALSPPSLLYHLTSQPLSLLEPPISHKHRRCAPFVRVLTPPLLAVMQCCSLQKNNDGSYIVDSRLELLTTPAVSLLSRLLPAYS